MVQVLSCGFPLIDRDCGVFIYRSPERPSYLTLRLWQ